MDKEAAHEALPSKASDFSSCIPFKAHKIDMSFVLLFYQHLCHNDDLQNFSPHVLFFDFLQFTISQLFFFSRSKCLIASSGIPILSFGNSEPNYSASTENKATVLCTLSPTTYIPP